MNKILHKQWEERDNRLYKAVIFKSFREAFAFMVQVAFLAEQNNHHPKWTNDWNKVELWLSTHDMGDVITEKDRILAKQIDEVLGVEE